MKRIYLLAAPIVLGAALVGCHTTSPTANCLEGRPFGQTPSAIFAARQTIINGEQHYLCHGRFPGAQSACWAVRHWDHKTFGPNALYCP